LPALPALLLARLEWREGGKLPSRAKIDISDRAFSTGSGVTQSRLVRVVHIVSVLRRIAVRQQITIFCFRKGMAPETDT